MKQEPVAWADEYNILMKVTDFEFQFPAFSIKPKEDGDWIPLYTAPRELSDAEMNEIIQFLNQSRISWSGNEFIKEAMRLAIKKASEK